MHLKTEATKQPLSRYYLTLEQALLLKAVVLEGELALTAWKEWKNRVDIEALDGTSYVLLPQLYQNLLSHRVEDPHMGRLKGIYRRNWYATQLQLKSLRVALTELSRAGIDVISLGDTAIHYYCRDRPITSNYLMVGSDQLVLTIETLTRKGWTATVPAPNAVFTQLQNRQQHKLYVQNHLFWGTPQEKIDQAVWQHAINLSTKQIDFLLPGFLPSPTDQLLDVCVRTFFKAGMLSIQGIADAFLIVQTSGDAIDWRRLVAQAQQYRLVLPLRNLLTVLQEVLQPTVPEWVMLVLKRLPITPHELLTYQILAEDWPLWSRLQLLLKQQRLKPQWLQLRYAPFPGRSLLKSLLVSRKSIIE